MKSGCSRMLVMWIYFLKNVKQRIQDQFKQNWRGRLQDSSRALFYNHIASFTFQPYLDFVDIFKFRKCMSMLRVSSHRLCIETGRWAKPNVIPLYERKCNMCDSIEDEYHFVLECSLYSEIRIKFIPKYYRVRPSMQKFVELICSDNKTALVKLSFIYHAFKLRTELLLTAN